MGLHDENAVDRHMNPNPEEDGQVVGIDLEVLDHECSHSQDCKGMEMKGNYFYCPFADQIVLTSDYTIHA